MSDFLSDSDRDILDAVVEHRVATAAHLSALLEIPERTIRYRLSGLRSKAYVRAVRPPATRDRHRITGVRREGRIPGPKASDHPKAGTRLPRLLPSSHTPPRSPVSTSRCGPRSGSRSSNG